MLSGGALPPRQCTWTSVEVEPQVSGWGGVALLNPITVSTERPLWHLQPRGLGLGWGSGHRVLGGQQLITWPWQVVPLLGPQFLSIYKGTPPHHPGHIVSSPIAHLLSQNPRARQSPQFLRTEGSKSPGAGVGMCPAHAGRIEGAQPVSGNTHSLPPASHVTPSLSRWLP